MGKKLESGWNELLKSVETEDSLPTRQSGTWAKEKLWFWNRYIEITTNAMVGHVKWPQGVAYVDLFAGPGVCTIRGTGERIPGSPIIAASAPKPFRKILLCELDPALATACERRVASRNPPGEFKVFCADCNIAIDEVVHNLPRGALTLAFLDPTGLHLHFETVRKLAASGAVDLLVLFPDANDILRNADHIYFNDLDSNLDRTLGFDSDWRGRKAELVSGDASALRRLFASVYKNQLRRNAGYEHFAEEVIRGPAGPLYRLIYATKHPRGLDFWNKSVAKELRGPRLL